LAYFARVFSHKKQATGQTNHEGKRLQRRKIMNEKKMQQKDKNTNKAKTKACGGKCKNNPSREENCK
jgi:hypothetical protein